MTTVENRAHGDAKSRESIRCEVALKREMAKIITEDLKEQALNSNAVCCRTRGRESSMDIQLHRQGR